MSERKRPPVAAIIGAIVAVQALLMLWFAWPAQEAEPRDLPVAVAGPQQATDALAAKLRAARPGAFDITAVADAAAADTRIRDRDVYGAFIVGPDGVSVHVASAASPAVAGALSQLAGSLGAGATVVDVVPTTADDPRGAGFAGAFLPLILTSIAAGAVIALALTARSARIAAILGYGLGAGLVAAGVMHWAGLLGGSYLGGAGAIALFTAAVAATVAGLYSVLGRAGIAIGALLVFVVGNPLSGLAAAPELLPQPWGQFGQYLPPGAGATVLRSAGFFDGAGSAQGVLVLAAYVLVGLLLVAAGTRPPTRDLTPERELVAA